MWFLPMCPQKYDIFPTHPLKRAEKLKGLLKAYRVILGMNGLHLAPSAVGFTPAVIPLKRARGSKLDCSLTPDRLA